ncbi:hypothetical protein IGS68_25740 [Skermanella sp. TT6]|uniref:Thioesterase domain-containing protein n=1 Tax=Skermanella cutis TaxID=2775420 RepID=A0ABX7B4R7_9PROT|nr:hypothetical protein [Skermanella sp. TT6]QQP89349.1 hypothetical protein IGS68_25740 [Skermanella sp. TT6]
MADYARKLEDLKNTLLTAETFARVQEKFFDELGMNRDFIAAGMQVDVPLLKAAFEQVGRQVFGPTCIVQGFALFRMEADKFVHGGCMMNGCLATVLYFEDVDVGLVAVSTDFSTGAMTYARISLMQGREGLEPGPVAPGPGTIQ